MTGYEIKHQAEEYTDELIDDVEALLAINRAMGLLGDMALIYDTAQVTVSEGQVGAWLALPSNAVYVREVTTADGQSYYRWGSQEGRIRFRDSGTYTVHFRRMPQPLESINETPEVHQAFHPVLVTYLIGWWKLKDDDENPDGLRHMQQFERDALRVFHALSRGRGTPQWTVIRRA